jgi:hypothetical protein
VPCRLNEAAIAYHLAFGYYAPEISGFTPDPHTVYQYRPTTFKCNLKKGTGPIQYTWSLEGSIYPPSAVTLTPNGNLVTVTYNSIPIFPSKVHVGCKAEDPYGQFDYEWFEITNSSNNGCPWLFVEDAESVSQIDNNLLNKSKFPEYIGQDITDRYVLSKTPGIIDSTITLSIGETTTDTSFINSIKLYAVDHPIGTKICITEDNQITIFDSASVLSVKEAYLNENEITRDIQFHISSKGTVQSDTLDHLNAAFDNNNIINPGIIADLKWNPNAVSFQKNCDGLINANLGNETFTSDFSRREYKSITAIPVTNTGGEDFSVSDINIDWYKGNEIRYIALASLSYTGFTTTELNFLSAFNSEQNDEIYKVIEIDSLYSKIDFSNSLTLKFRALSELPSDAIIRDYVIEVNGRIGSYLNPMQKYKTNRLKIVKQKNNTIAYKNKLNQNYPNPFNPLTKISYSVAKQGLVTIKIYDILGREIKSLVNEIKGPGNYLIEFNGSYLASGVYFYRLETNGFVDIKRMVLIK